MSPFQLRADADSGADTPNTSEQTETNAATDDTNDTVPTEEVNDHDQPEEGEQPSDSTPTANIHEEQEEGDADGEGEGEGEGEGNDAAASAVEDKTDSPPSEESQTIVPEGNADNAFENFDSNNDLQDEIEEQKNDENSAVPTKFTVESQVEEEEIQEETSHQVVDDENNQEDENIESNDDAEKQNQEEEQEEQEESNDKSPDAKEAEAEAEAEKEIDQSKTDDKKTDENKNSNKKRNNKKNDPIERKPVPRPSKAERNQKASTNPQQINIDAQQPYNTTTNNIQNYKFVGGEGGKDFAIQVKNEVVKKIKVIFNMKRVTRIEMTFYGDSKESKKVQTYGKSFQDIREQTEFTSEFEFQPGEQLKGELVIATNSDTLTVRTRDVGYIYFNTVFGRTFEAGNRKQATKDVHYRFDVDKHFFAGVFGRALKYINCLGLLLYQKISSERFDNLKFPEVNKSDFKIKMQDGETTKICNNDPSKKTISKNLKYPVPDGEYRAVWLDHPYYNINYINYTKNVQIPTVNEGGKLVYETMTFTQFVKDSKFVNNYSTQIVELDAGECATIKYSAKIAMQDNIPFDLKHKFNIGDLKNYTQDVQLRGYTSMEKKIYNKVEVIYTDASNKVIKKKEKKAETKSNQNQPKGGKESADKPNPMYSQNITTEDKKGNIMVGGSGGKFFSSQKSRNIISSFKAFQNNSGIKKIIIHYFGDIKSYEFGSENTNNKMQSKEIKFEQGEQLVGNIKLSGNKDGVAYISFQTLYGQTFEAGQQSESNDTMNFPAKMTFLSGVQGQQSQSINKLGFILFKKFDKVTQSNLKWPKIDEIEFKTKEQTGESKLVCNSDKKEKEVELAYPSASGEYRTVVFDHKVQSLKDITLEKVTVPSIDMTGKNKMYDVSSLEEKSFSSTNVKVKIPLKSGQCVQLKQSVKTVEHDNLKFTIKQDFYQDLKSERFALINGAMSFKKVISSNVQPVFSNKVVKTLLQMHRDSLLEQQFFD